PRLVPGLRYPRIHRSAKVEKWRCLLLLKRGVIAGMAERFYVNSALGPGPLEITGDEAHHLAVVCRVRPGDTVVLFNGDGCDYPAVVVEVRKRGVGVEVERAERPRRELPFRLEVAAPLPKGDRAQFLIEKLTELGATA